MDSDKFKKRILPEWANSFVAENQLTHSVYFGWKISDEKNEQQ